MQLVANYTSTPVPHCDHTDNVFLYVLHDSVAFLGLGERWCMICRCIEERLNLLQTIQAVNLEQDRLNAYLQAVEAMLKDMEMCQEVDSAQLQEQTNRIMVSQEMFLCVIIFNLAPCILSRLLVVV